MRHLRIFAAVAVLGSLATAPASFAAEREPLRLVFIAYQNADRLLESVEPVIEYLRGALGRPVEYFAATDYAAVVESLKNETADAGFMGPLQYIIAHEQAGAYPILGELYDGAPTYVSRIFVRKDSGIESLADLEGRTIAFVDPLSSSGYMFPLEIFRDAELVSDREDADRFFRKIYFAGGDEQAMRAVLNRFVEAAGIGQYSYSLLHPEERDEIRVLADSRPIPSHGVFMRRGADPETAAALREALLALNVGPNRGLLQYLYSVDGYVAAGHETYAEVERLAREYGFID